MIFYLDSEDPFYSRYVEPKQTKPAKKENEIITNKILIIFGIVVNIIIAIYIGQYVVGHYLIAHGQEENTNYTITIHPRSMEELKMIQQYCFDHADKILNGKNPINDLIATGLIELSEYLGTTCDEIPDYIEQAQDQLRDK